MANKSVVLYQSIKIGNKWVLRPVDEDSSHFSVGPFYVGWYDGKKKHVGLNKGEQQNALRRAVFFNRLGEIRDRSPSERPANFRHTFRAPVGARNCETRNQTARAG